MEESQLPVTRKRKRDNPNAEAEEQGTSKGEAVLPFDAAKLDREKIEGENFDDDNTGILRKLTERSSNSHEVSEWKEVCLLGTLLLPSGQANSVAREISVPRMVALKGIMEALACCDINMIGVCGPDATETANLVEKVSRTAKKDNLFDVVVKASVTRKPDNKKIQDEIAEALGIKFEEKALAKRAERLRDRIITGQRILVILRDLCKGLDLDKVGIPFGADHTGCKLLLTSASEEVLSNKMFAQKIFKL